MSNSGVSLRFGAGAHLDLASPSKVYAKLNKFKESIVAGMLKAARQSRHHSRSICPVPGP